MGTAGLVLVFFDADTERLQLEQGCKLFRQFLSQNLKRPVSHIELITILLQIFNTGNDTPAVETISAQLYTKFRSFVFDIAFPRKVGNKHPLFISHPFRAHVLISPGCFHNGVDMNPTFVCKSTLSNKRPGFQGHEVGGVRHISGKRKQLRQFFCGDALGIHFFTKNRYDGC